MAIALLDRGANPGAADKNGEHALSWAAFNGLGRVLQRLIEDGFPLDRPTTEGNTALLEAVKRDHHQIAESLLAAGASVDLNNRKGESALSIAVAEGHADLAALLRQYGAKQ